MVLNFDAAVVAKEDHWESQTVWDHYLLNILTQIG